MTLIDLANPTKFLSLTARVLPWLAGATAILLLIGFYQAAMAPDDYQHGAVGEDHVHPRAECVAVDVRLERDEPCRARHAGMAASAGRCRGESGSPDRSCLYLFGAGDRLAVGAADVGHLLAMGCAAHLRCWSYFLILTLIGAWCALGSMPGGAAQTVLSVVGALNLPIIKFSVDWWNTLHQPASVLRIGGPTLDKAFLIPLLVMAVGFSLLFVTLHLAAMRNEILRRRVRSLQMMQASQPAA